MSFSILPVFYFTVVSPLCKCRRGFFSPVYGGMGLQDPPRLFLGKRQNKFTACSHKKCLSSLTLWDERLLRGTTHIHQLTGALTALH